MKQNFIGGYPETESRKIELYEWPALGITQEIHTQTNTYSNTYSNKALLFWSSLNIFSKSQGTSHLAGENMN